MKWNVPGKCGPHGELFFFIKEELAIMPGSETFSPSFAADIRRPFFSADVLTKCALIALHLLEEDGGVESGSGWSPDLGDRERYGRPKSLDLDDDVES